MEPQSLSIGIDVSKHQLDYASHDRPQQGQFPNNAAGIAALIEALTPLAPERIVVESTGGTSAPWHGRSPTRRCPSSS